MIAENRSPDDGDSSFSVPALRQAGKLRCKGGCNRGWVLGTGRAPTRARSRMGVGAMQPLPTAKCECNRCQQPSVNATAANSQVCRYARSTATVFADEEPTICYPAPRRLNPGIPYPLQREWEEASHMS